jgi:hypothetical protein
MSSQDPEKIFSTRDAAERACERLNREPPEFGYSPWYLGQHGGEWWVIRSRGVMAEELSTSVAVYEEALRSALESDFSDRERWRKLEGIEMESVTVDGDYPDTTLSIVFSPVPNDDLGERQFDCRFGYRVPIWPAEDSNPEGEARALIIYFGEFLGTDGRARPIWHGPCDRTEVTWLN